MGDLMSRISDSEDQARVLKETKAASEKKRKLEEDIRITDGRSKFAPRKRGPKGYRSIQETFSCYRDVVLRLHPGKLEKKRVEIEKTTSNLSEAYLFSMPSIL
jgi:hypothetical protein